MKLKETESKKITAALQAAKVIAILKEDRLQMIIATKNNLSQPFISGMQKMHTIPLVYKTLI